jgi:hypothetical protein
MILSSSILFNKHHYNAKHYDCGWYCQKYLVKLTNQILSNKKNCKHEVTEYFCEVFVSLMLRHSKIQECFDDIVYEVDIKENDYANNHYQYYNLEPIHVYALIVPKAILFFLFVNFLILPL